MVERTGKRRGRRKVGAPTTYVLRWDSSALGAGGTIQTTKEAGNILFSEQQRLRVKWNTSLVRAESGFFERIDAREKEEKLTLMRSDDEEEEVSSGEEKAPRFAIRERDYDWIPFYFARRRTSTTTSKRKRSLNVGRTIHALAIEIKPK